MDSRLVPDERTRRSCVTVRAEGRRWNMARTRPLARHGRAEARRSLVGSQLRRGDHRKPDLSWRGSPRWNVLTDAHEPLVEHSLWRRAQKEPDAAPLAVATFSPGSSAARAVARGCKAQKRAAPRYGCGREDAQSATRRSRPRGSTRKWSIPLWRLGVSAVHAVDDDDLI